MENKEIEEKKDDNLACSAPNTEIIEKLGISEKWNINELDKYFQDKESPIKKDNDLILDEFKKLFFKKNLLSWREYKDLYEGIKYKYENEAVQAILGKEPNKKDYIERLKTIDDGYYLGYTLKKNDIDIPITAKNGGLTFISAPTKHGKTTALFNFFLNIIDNTPNEKHYFFSYEEADHAILTKIASSYLNKELSKDNYKSIKHFYKNIDDKKERVKYFNEMEYPKIEEIKMKLDKYWETIGKHKISYANLDIDNLIKTIEIISKEEKTGCIFIDYLQLIPVLNEINRNQTIKELCNRLKNISVSTNKAIIVATQFNRETRKPEDLITQNLAEGSEIEKSANQVIGLWHFGKEVTGFTGNDIKTIKEKYKKNSNYKDHFDDDKKCLIKIMANRDGESNIEGVFNCDYNIKKIKTGKGNKIENINKSINEDNYQEEFDNYVYK